MLESDGDIKELLLSSQHGSSVVVGGGGGGGRGGRSPVTLAGSYSLRRTSFCPRSNFNFP